MPRWIFLLITLALTAPLVTAPAARAAEDYPKLPYRATVLEDQFACVTESAHHRWAQYFRARDHAAAHKIAGLYCTWFRKGDTVIVLDDYDRRMRVKRPDELTEYLAYGFEVAGRWHDGKKWPPAPKPKAAEPPR